MLVDSIMKGAEKDVHCPYCGNENTHHGRVEVFERDKEDGQTFMKTPGFDGHNETFINPSKRRDAVRINFEGECGHSFRMDIIQHKGNTHISFN